MNEIRAALNAGKEVITHTDSISVPGWTGAGYIIFDPVTGDGAYKISGGANGAFAKIKENLDKVLFWLASMGDAFIGQFGGFISKAIAGIKNQINIIKNYIDLLSQCPLGIAIAGIVSIVLMTAGFVTATLAAGSVNPIYGMIVAMGGAALVAEVGNSFLLTCAKAS